jgi:hypothetical protein
VQEVVVRKAIGLALIVAGMAFLGIGYSIPSGRNVVAPEQQSQIAPRIQIAKGQPAGHRAVAPVVSGGWQNYWHAKAIPNAIDWPAPAVVTLAARPPLLMLQKATSMPKDRTSLARALQQELKRVGCYEGKLNGVWTPLTRKAMKAFNDRINAALPIGEPNQILLTLVRSHDGKICGAPCPTGQSIADEDRCLPNAILALAHTKAVQRIAVPERRNPTKATKSTTLAITSWSTTAATMAQKLPLPGGDKRMALAGPIDERVNATPKVRRLTVRTATSVPPPRPAKTQRNNFGPKFFTRLDRIGNN